MIYLYHNLYFLGMRNKVAAIRYYADGLPRLETAPGYDPPEDRCLCSFIRRVPARPRSMLFLGSILIFLGVRALPGDPARVLAGEEATPSTIAAIRHEYALDKPLPVQYLSWVGHALHGDFGRSTQDRFPVAHIIVQRLPITMELSLLAMLVAIGVGVTAGIVAAMRRGRPSTTSPPGSAWSACPCRTSGSASSASCCSRSSCTGCRPRGTSRSPATRAATSNAC